jgi:hypothetical protein
MPDCLPRATFETWLAVVALWVTHWEGHPLADLPAWPWAAAYRLGWSANQTAMCYCAWLREVQVLSLPAPPVVWGEAVVYRGRAARLPRAAHG